MSSVVTLELDTTPPRVDFHTPHRSPNGLRVPYDLSEDGIVSADFNGDPVSSGPTDIFIPAVPGTITVHTADDVLNIATWQVIIPAVGTYQPHGLYGYNADDDKSFADGGGSVYGSEPDSDYSDGGAGSYSADSGSDYEEEGGGGYGFESDSDYEEDDSGSYGSELDSDYDDGGSGEYGD